MYISTLHGLIIYTYVRLSRKYLTYYQIHRTIVRKDGRAMISYSDMLSFWKRVRDLLSEDLNQAWLCRKIGVSSSSLSAWINRDRIPKADMAVKIAEALGVSVEFLVTGKEYDEDEEDTQQPVIPEGQFITPSQKEYTISTNQKIIYIPILEQKISAGFGEELIDQIEPTRILPVLERLVASYGKDRLRVVEVKGDSMTGVQLFSGDLVVFAVGHIAGDGIYVISINNEAFVKRLEFEPIENEIIIHSENNRYNSKTIAADTENVKVVGKVVGWYHNHPY